MMSGSLDSQIRAILTLLADEDERTVDLVTRSLLDISPDAIEPLRRAGQQAAPLARERLANVFEAIEQSRLERAFEQWLERDSPLEEGVFLLAQFEYPQIDPPHYGALLDQMAGALRQKLRSNRSIHDAIHRINSFLFQDLGFRGNTQNYYDPDNSYFNRLLERRTGIPISLSVLYLLLAERLDLPIVGVGLPGHFMVRYESGDAGLFLDAFNGGQILSREECVRFLINSGYEVHDSFLTAVSKREILLRMMRNLIYIYTQLRDEPRTHRLNRLVEILELDR
jgi:regulator of sirC expression with transglutaminase-like and TPR domain